jgi:hypothetical protein
VQEKPGNGEGNGEVKPAVDPEFKGEYEQYVLFKKRAEEQAQAQGQSKSQTSSTDVVVKYQDKADDRGAWWTEVPRTSITRPVAAGRNAKMTVMPPNVAAWDANMQQILKESGVLGGP